MIDITKLTDKDVGRSVIYTPGYGPLQDGVITSFNEKFVFVRYRATGGGQATNPKDLEFLTDVIDEIQNGPGINPSN